MMVLICALLLSFLTLKINAQSLTGNWPPLDTPPPFQQEWSSLVDFSKVPNAPVVKTVGENCPTTDTYCNWSCTNCVNNETDIIDCPSKTDWGLSFDDGPTQFTPTLLDYLDSQQIKLTFFVIGSRVFENPATLKREVDSGHQIGVHTWSHTALTTQTNEEIIAEIKWTELAIQQAVGITPKYMRPPFGDVDNRVRAILQQLGYKVVIWDKDTNDWMSGDTPDTFQMSWVEGNFTEWVKENDPTGHISLEHDLYNQTAAQAPLVVPIVKGAGFNILPVYQCVGDTSYYVTNSTTTTSPAPAATTVSSDATVSTPSTQSYLQNDTSSSDVTSPSPSPSPSQPSQSNAISYINNNNYYSLYLVLLMLGYFII